MNFAVLGAGNSGQAAAADLALKGFQVNLYNRSDSRIIPIKKEGGIEVTGALQGFAKLNKVSTNIRDAIQDVDVICVTVPAFAYASIIDSLMPCIEDKQIIVFNSYYGALQFVAKLRRMKDVMIAENTIFIFACRVTGPAKVKIFGIKNRLPMAAFPSKNTEKILEVLREAYPQLVPATNVLETSINNLNPIAHTPIMILNAGWIESSGGNFLFYKDGETSSVKRVRDVLDKEKLAVAKALDLEPVSSETWTRIYYPKGRPLDTLKAPSTLQARQISEDVPYGLVPLASFGNLLRVDTPIIDSIINIASAINQTNYWNEGLTVEKMGLAGLNKSEIKRYLTYGELEN